jgi:hypothetical protein
MKKAGIIAALSMLLVALAASPALGGTVFNAAAAPNGTHVQTGTPTCTVSGTTVSCPSYELAGVGNTNATATLALNYTATVNCRNHGGQIVAVKSQVTGASVSTGQLEPKNGRLTVPALSSANATPPTDEQFEAAATCPNGNWTKETVDSTIALSSFTYTLHFTGFTGDYITITP